MADELPSTPKRKRGVDTLLTPIKFSFDPDRTAEDGGNSPRTKVAHSFRGLAIEGEGGSGVAFGGDEADSATRKRQRQDVDTTDLDAETVPKPEVDRETQREATGRTNPEDTRDIQVADTKVVDLGDARGIRFEVAEGIKLKDTNDIKPDVTEDTKLSRTPQKTTPPQPRSRKGRKRVGTPPPRNRRMKGEADSDGQNDDEMDIVEPIRAALTWQEDEITIYDPEDADDDGTGINGVGFRPTPALAHARFMKRRKQIAEYRKREESEARAWRSQRRHGQHHMTPSPEGAPRSRNVKFIEENNCS